MKGKHMKQDELNFPHFMQTKAELDARRSYYVGFYMPDADVEKMREILTKIGGEMLSD
jgi:hypothetical protein